MNTSLLSERTRTLILIALVAGAGSACIERRTVIRERGAPPPPGGAETEEFYVEQEPPAPQVEVVTVAPGPEHVWVAGHWHWNHAWVWVPGIWIRRPHAHAEWVAGGWNRRGRGWVWVGGRWRG